MLETGKKLPQAVWALLLIGGLHFLYLGSFHNHDHESGLYLTAQHICFLCHASSGVDVETGSISVGQVDPAVTVMPVRVDTAPAIPIIHPRSARSPPL
jgi:hypothetical protein